MIRVQPADEPGSFDEIVRQPGLRALSRRVGEKRPGAGHPPNNTYSRRDTWFALELVGFQVVPGPTTVDPLRTTIDATINVVLDLNNPKLRTQRSSYAAVYLSRHISYAYLQQRAPFVARELQRQNKLLPADQPPVTP